MPGKRLRILAVCGVGQGSSLILRMYVEDVLREMKLDARVETADVATAKSTPCDLILVSPHLAVNLSGSEVPVRSVHRFTDKNELRQILEEFKGR